MIKQAPYYFYENIQYIISYFVFINIKNVNNFAKNVNNFLKKYQKNIKKCIVYSNLFRNLVLSKNCK